MIRRPPRSTRVRSSAASDVYKRQRIALQRGRREWISFSRKGTRTWRTQRRPPLRRGAQTTGATDSAPHPSSCTQSRAVPRASMATRTQGCAATSPLRPVVNLWDLDVSCAREGRGCSSKPHSCLYLCHNARACEIEHASVALRARAPHVRVDGAALH